MKMIDHDPEEPKIDRGPGPWRWVFPVIGVILALNIFTREIDWVSLALGLGLGCTLAGWAIDLTGNKVPANWRRKSPDRNRNTDF
ncbi:hypothetical protein QTA58_00205 [Neorhizobium sp. CSC1952]|uniref:hypothetical protein n=1 Tax=Neorhizobium sp. CSC1952 TaxID=2978974 RepID=UPI0025A68CF7|nr:hypothetical protein [Rhizobium sp. CSC1952]WJR67231.1 hypothetical protein QTA58_00205 [Rhizobium sp. CSC1952]